MILVKPPRDPLEPRPPEVAEASSEDGRLHDGLVVNEAPGTLTLRNSQAEDQTFLRSNIEEIRASSVSLMPEGLESDLGPQDVADLISFLQGLDLTADN